MKKFITIAVIAAAMVACMVSCKKKEAEAPAAESSVIAYLNANDLEKQAVKADVQLEDGFVLRANDSKAMSVDVQEQATKAGEETFTNRINLKGAGDATFRSVSFKAAKGNKVTIYGLSSSKKDARQLAVKDAEGNQVFIMDVAAYVEQGEASVASFTVEKDSDFYAFSPKSGAYIYQIKIEK